MSLLRIFLNPSSGIEALKSASLQKADLAGANLSGANLQDADLTGAMVSIDIFL